MSMYHSIEVRVPFLDHKLVEYLSSLPSDLKLSKKLNKPLLIEAISDLLSQEIFNRPKMGFTVPSSKWLQANNWSKFWAKKVLRMAKLLPKEAIVYTQNPWTADCFKKIKVKVKSHPLFFNRLSATQVRRKIVENKKWENLVPKTVFDFLVKINGEKRIKALPSRATSTKVL